MKSITLTIDILDNSYVVRASRPGKTRHFREDVAVSLEALGELVISLTASEQLSAGPSKDEIANEEEWDMVQKLERFIANRGRPALRDARLPPGYGVEYSHTTDTMRLHTPTHRVYELQESRIRAEPDSKFKWI